jgi:hypothetical protein
MTTKAGKYSTQIWLNQFDGTPCDRDDSHAIFFASILESNVYRILLARNLQIIRQRKIEIKPKTAMFPAMGWACDFRIWNKENIENGHLNIEAKGISFESFVIKLQMLELHAPEEFKKTILVIQDSSTHIPRILSGMEKKRQVVTLEQFHDKLTELGF